MASVVPPFGGNTPRVNLSPMAMPPAYGYRVIPGATWWGTLYLLWRKYRADFMGATPATPPPLARPGQGVYFTDQDSLQGLRSPGEFAARLGLRHRTQSECQFYGLVVIEFEILSSMHIVLPPPASNCRQGLTPGNAREWKTTADVLLDESMRVTYIDPMPPSRYFTVPL